MRAQIEHFESAQVRNLQSGSESAPDAHRANAGSAWQMRGEVRATDRPANSLLAESLHFDHSAPPRTLHL